MLWLQLTPFPFDLVQRELRRYPNAEFMWAQEEPMNMGAYTHICPRLETCMRNEDREVNSHHLQALPEQLQWRIAVEEPMLASACV